jgi:hypothetical protein
MRDDFTADVKQVLASRANHTCSNPGCGAPTSGPQADPSKSVNIGVAAHITAASPGGARYDGNLTSEQRSSALNGIWLCQNCAKLVDNDETQFTTDYLKAWKTISEHNARLNIGQTGSRRVETEADKKLRALREWVGKPVMLVKMPTQQQAMTLGERPWAAISVNVVDVTELFVVINRDNWEHAQSYPLDQIGISWDDKRSCLEILQYIHGNR